MARGVVHGLEAVEVAEDDAEDVSVARRLGDLRLEPLHEASPIEGAGEVVVAGEPTGLGHQARVRDRDRGLGGVQTHEPQSLFREDARPARVRRERAHDLAVRDERHRERGRDDLVERHGALRVRRVIGGDDHLARLDDRERDTPERLADGVAQAQERALVEGADDEPVPGLRKRHHRTVRPREQRRLARDECRQVVERELSGRREPDLVQRLKL